MKSILIVLFVAITSITNVNLQETEKMNGMFVGYEDGTYSPMTMVLRQNLITYQNKQDQNMI